MTKAAAMLDMLEHNTKQGRGTRFIDIQRFLWEYNHTPDQPFFIEDTCRYNTRAGLKPMNRNRGYWCTNLVGGMHYGPGLLHKFAEKRGNLWYRNSVPHNNHPWRSKSDCCVQGLLGDAQ